MTSSSSLSLSVLHRCRLVARVLECAHTESRSVPGGIGLVKLMGRHAGFVTARATIANQYLNFALVPEVPFSLHSFLSALNKRMLAKSHALIAVAEGAGQDLLQIEAYAQDASGNVKLKDIGLFLRYISKPISKLRIFLSSYVISIPAIRSAAVPLIASTTFCATSSRATPPTPRWLVKPASSSARFTTSSSTSLSNFSPI